MLVLTIKPLLLLSLVGQGAMQNLQTFCIYYNDPIFLHFSGSNFLRFTFILEERYNFLPVETLEGAV